MNIKTLILILLNVSISLAVICVNLNSNCQNFANFCNSAVYRKVMISNCPETCGICINVQGNTKPKKKTKSITVSTDEDQEPIGPCLNGMCPSGHVCINNKCYPLSVSSSSSSEQPFTITKGNKCIDLIDACSTFTDYCGNYGSYMDVKTYCPMTCGVCTFGKK